MNGLAGLLKARIERTGPIGLDDYMAACLADPQWGYYRRADPLGRDGDFITAPEISQMFGELIGLWAGVVWQTMGAPRHLLLVEWGPGRGTLMADLLRAAPMVPGFADALSVHLVEISEPLRRRQRQALAGHAVTWHDRYDDLPDGPLLLIANEFFDALPIRQYVRRADGWRERRVGLGTDGGFCFVDGPIAAIDAPAAAPGEIFEINPVARQSAGWLGQRLETEGGAALIIDYGHSASAIGETLQAVRGHRYAEVFDAPGEADLTAHVDFQAIGQAARPAKATEVVTQGAFLRALGIEMRAERLMTASPKTADVVASACRRLIEPSGMGTLFKVRALTHSGLPTPPGFVR
jgi:NADH dehydrogenase [ubiquinone] 1 alpha subcomplex assembly factor 7